MTSTVLNTSAVFRSTTASAPVTPLAEKINYFWLEDSNPNQDVGRRARAAVALALLRQMNEGTEMASAENTIGYILTGTFLLFPRLRDEMVDRKAGALVMHQFPFTTATVANHFMAVESQLEAGEEVRSSDLPVHGFVVTLRDWQAGIELVAARWGVEMYPIGKPVSAANLAGFRTNRILAITRYYKVESTDNEALSTACLPTLPVLASIDRAFNVYKAIRFHYAMHWVNAAKAGSDTREGEAFLLTFRLTDGAGLGAPTFILDLLYAHPALISFPQLRPQIATFLKSVEEYMRTLDPSTRGFVKVVFGSNYRLFSSSSRGALLALAVIHRAQTEPSAGRFVDTTQFTSVLAQANTYLVEGGHPPITTTTATQQVAELTL